MLKKAEVESLWRLIETLRKRSLDYGNELEAREALTRYALVNPLLRELGWNTEDPAQVRPEYLIKSSSDTTKKIKPGSDTTKKFADYALFKDGQNEPSVLVEAKSLPTKVVRSMSDPKERWQHLREAAEQALSYNVKSRGKVRYFAATDGLRWEIYDTTYGYPPNKPPDDLIDRMWIKSFDLTGGDRSINKYRLMEELRLAEELWRDNPNHKGTKRIVEAGERCLDAEGYELTPGGNRSKDKDGNLKEAYPRAAEYRVGKYFLDVNGYKLKKNGAPYNVSKPYEPPSDYKGPYRYQPPAKKRRRR